MKLTTVIALITALQISASSYSQNTMMSVNVKNGTFSDIIQAIEEQSEFKIFYKNDQIDLLRPVSVRAREKTVATILNEALEGTDIKYTLLDKIIVLAPENSISKQGITVKGTVTSAVEGEPLPGVNVVVKGTTEGAVTDINGQYTISVPNGESTLVFSYVGFITEEIAVNNQTTLDVVLVEDIQSLEEVVVIGYGSRQKKDVTTSISTVSSDDLEKATSMSADVAMQGRMSGVFVQSNGASPFERPTIRIRGTNTWGVSDPLFVVDGIPITEFGAGGEGQYGQGSTSAGRITDLRGNINFFTLINPNDIESISVLKDASAAAIYGVRAANGVVLITTKKGKSGRPVIELNTKTSFQNIPNTYDVLDVPAYVDLYNEMYRNNPDELNNLPDVFKDSIPNAYLGNLPSVDWQRPYINKNAPITDVSLKVSGGTENTNYYVSSGYSYSESVYMGDDQERYTLATNINSKINKMLRTGVNYRFTLSNVNEENNTNISDLAFSPPPWQPIYDPNGPEFLLGYAPTNELWYDEDGNFQSRRLYGPETFSNRFGQQEMMWRRREMLRNMGTAFVEFEPVKGLVFRGTLSADWYQYKEGDFTSVNTQYFNETPSDPLDGGIDGEDDTKGDAALRHNTNYNLVKEFSITYGNTFGKHSVNILLNAMNQEYGYEVANTSNEIVLNTFPDIYYVPQPEVDREFTSGFSERYRFGLQGYLGRLSYNYDNKYYVEGTVRRDGTSRFSEDNRWGTFPSFSAAWRLSSEPFIQFTWLDDLKLRFGWGQLGNEQTLAYAFLSLINRNPTYAYGSGNGDARGIFNYGAALPTYPNPNVGWETTTTMNIGFDAILMGNIDFSFEYYSKLTDGILQASNLPASVGNESAPIINIAEVINTGIETSLAYRGRVGDFSYRISGNLTTVKNEVLSMYDDAPIDGTDLEGTSIKGRIEEGYPINYIWGYQVDGIFQNQEDVDDWQAGYEDRTIGRQEPGDLYFQDVHGAPTETERFYSETPDGIVNDNDRTYLGKTIPGFYYGLTFDLAYKGFDVSAFLQGVGDVQKYNAARARGMAMDGLGNNMLTDVQGRWTTSNTGSDIPRAVAGDPANNNRFSDRFVEEAWYLRFGNFQVGYTLPSILAERAGFYQNLRVWIGGSNLFTITSWTGLDPENEESPLPRIFSVGIDARF